jgi:hypothetical protein
MSAMELLHLCYRPKYALLCYDIYQHKYCRAGSLSTSKVSFISSESNCLLIKVSSLFITFVKLNFIYNILKLAVMR